MNKPIQGHRKAMGQIYVRNNGALCRLEEAKELVLRIKGVLNVETNHMSDMLVIDYDPEKVTLDQIRKTVENGDKTQTPN
jgi:hypothetical protein